SLGPAIDMARFYATPWRRGRRLVDEHGRPYRAADIEEKNLYTAFAEGSDKEALASSVVLVRLPKDQLHLPSELSGYPADGIVAYSKICTHAGCAISLYRAPLFPPNDPGPALVCPCHYSTFDPATGGDVTFGPAGRKLPMLPLLIAPNGELRAKGNFDEPVGPSWWGVRLKKPTS
ncbi:MAG TPA: Rieske (2Fe-2S) protein, partial [Gaiellaceae bacterium]